MKVKELIERLQQQPPDAEVATTCELLRSGVSDVIWDGEETILYDGDPMYPVETDTDSRIVPGSAVKSHPPCDYDYALVRRKTVLDREWWVIERAWDI